MQDFAPLHQSQPRTGAAGQDNLPSGGSERPDGAGPDERCHCSDFRGGQVDRIYGLNLFRCNRQNSHEM